MGCPLVKDITKDCEAPQMGGVKDYAILINLLDWLNSTCTIDGTTKEITGITLASGGVEGFQYQVLKSSQIIATSILRRVDGVDGYDHSVALRLNTIEELDVRELQKLRWNKVVAIVPQQDSRARVYGGWVNSTPTPLGLGLLAMETDDNIGDASLGGTKFIRLATPDFDPPEIREPHLIASTVDLSALLTPTV